MAAASAPVSIAPGATPEIISRPYLAVIGPPPLRFAAAIPPPDLSARPAIGAPPNPAAENANPASAVGSNAPMPSTPAVAEPSPDLANGSASQPADAIPTPDLSEPAAKTPPPILSDDTRPRVKTEDFLPFFVFPNPHVSPQVVVPAEVPVLPTPGTLPPSSATYRQQ